MNIFYNVFFEECKKDFSDKTGNDYLITLKYEPNFLGSLLGAKQYYKRYYGSCTIWREASTGIRQVTSMEEFLCDIWKHNRRNSK